MFVCVVCDCFTLFSVSRQDCFVMRFLCALALVFCAPTARYGSYLREHLDAVHTYASVSHPVSAVDMAYDAIAFKKTKHILRAAEFLRDLVAREVLLLRHVAGRVMIADLLTKAVSRAIFVVLIALLDAYARSGVACPS